MLQLDVEALDAALGGVSEESLEMRRLKLLVVDNEREAVEATTLAILHQQAKHLARDVVRKNPDSAAGGRVRPAALPEVAPPLGESRRADGVLEREVGQYALTQVIRQRRNADHRDRLFAVDPLLNHTPSLCPGTAVVRFEWQCRLPRDPHFLAQKIPSHFPLRKLVQHSSGWLLEGLPTSRAGGERSGRAGGQKREAVPALEERCGAGAAARLGSWEGLRE